MEIKQNFIAIKGKVIKAEPARKTGYYVIIQEWETGKQQGAFSQWNYELETNGLFILRQDNKYHLITNYQVLSEPKSINQKENEMETKQIINQFYSPKFYQQYQTQEIQRLKQALQEQKEQNQKHQQDKQELINLTLNNNYIYSQLFSQRAQKIKSKCGKLSQWDKEQLENDNIALTQLQQERKELIVQLGKY